MATAVTAHSHQGGPPRLKVAQLGLTKTKPWRDGGNVGQKAA